MKGVTITPRITSQTRPSGKGTHLAPYIKRRLTVSTRASRSTYYRLPKCKPGEGSECGLQGWLRSYCLFQGSTAGKPPKLLFGAMNEKGGMNSDSSWPAWHYYREGMDHPVNINPSFMTASSKGEGGRVEVVRPR